MWGRLTQVDSARALLPLAIEQKVSFVPGDIYYGDQADARTLRLSFATPSPEQIHEGIARIGRALSQLSV
jgi:2-aminoadipate transaminase